MNPKQYSRAGVLAVWAAATVPMGLLAWVVAPAVAGTGASRAHFAETLIVALTAGLVWQCVLVLGLVYAERRSLRWSVLRDALWLNPPSTPDGRRGGRLWLWVLPFILGFLVLQFLPIDFPEPVRRSLGDFLSSTDGQQALHHNWGLFALAVAMLAFNTVFGEELLFRGLLLPRMQGAFGRWDWAANGVLFAVYHLHVPWVIPQAFVDICVPWAAKRYRSALVGIAVHSVQSVFFMVLVLALVLK